MTKMKRYIIVKKQFVNSHSRSSNLMRLLMNDIMYLLLVIYPNGLIFRYVRINDVLSYLIGDCFN